MTDFYKISFLTTWTVILLCLIRSGFSYPTLGNTEDIKHNMALKRETRSTHVDRTVIEDLLNDILAGDEPQLTGQRSKRQGRPDSFLPSLELLSFMAGDLRRQQQDQRQLALIAHNDDLFRAGGRR